MPFIMPAKIIKLLGTPNDAAIISDAGRRLHNGEIVITPTETVYGAAALLSNPRAIARLKEIRATDDGPITPHLASAEQAQLYTGPIGELAKRLMNKLWPGPVGLIFDVDAKTRKTNALKLKARESDLYLDGSITLRCPDHPTTAELLHLVDAPIVAISAAGPWETWTNKVDLILDAGPTRYARPSTLIKIEPNEPPGYRIVRSGVYDARIIEKMLKTTILFVCSGNTCRSPMAEALARQIAADRLKVSQEELTDKGYVIASAGVIAASGGRATAPAVAAIEQLGGDLTKHRSRPLSPELIHQTDAIFVMGENHRRAVMAMAPNAAARVHLLDPTGDIDDPIGGDVALYLSLARRLNTLIEDRLSALKLV
jgi:L-threonylcarbamoyladenylate synthase